MLLGKEVTYPQKYDPSVLHRIARKHRTDSVRFQGFDRWFCYELSFLLQSGMPYCCGLEISFSADSEYLVESKSLKLYLGSFAFETFRVAEDCLEKIIGDLKGLLGDQNITARLLELKDPEAWQVRTLPGSCIDSEDIFCSEFSAPKSDLLETEDYVIEESLYSNLFRSLCPVTAQPDYASVLIKYKGSKIKAESLLKYLVSYRNHNDFHESCCERIFYGISEKCHCQELTVACFFTRRGGIEINPVRSSKADLISLRTIRQ